MEAFDFFIIIGFSLLFLCGIIGNVLVIYVFKHLKGNHASEMKMLILYLAAFDLLSSILNPALFIYWQITSYNKWIFGQVGCKLLPGFQKMSVTASLGMVLLITFERCLIITRNIKLSKLHLRIAVFALVVISLLVEVKYIINLDLFSSETKVSFNCEHDSNINYNNKLKNYGVLSFKNKTDSSYLNNLSYVGNDEISFISILTCKEVETSNMTLDSISNQNIFSLDSHTSLQTIKNWNSRRKAESLTCKRNCYALNYACSSRLNNSHFDIGIFLTRIIISIGFVSVCNFCIYRTLYNPDKEHVLNKQESALKPSRIFRMLVVMAIVFIVLVLPKDVFIVTYTLLWLNNGIGMQYETALKINAFMALLQTTNCVCNIFIYARLHKRFKRTLTEKSSAITTLVGSLSQWRYRNQSRFTSSVKYHHCMYCEKYYPYCERESNL